MRWLDELKYVVEDKATLRNGDEFIYPVKESELDRLIELAERFEYLCMVEYPCEERHCPERGVDYVVHDKTCPYSDDWKKEGT